MIDPYRVFLSLNDEQYAAVSELLAAERARALGIVQAEIDRATALLDLEEDGVPVFDRAQMEAGICALKTVADLIGQTDS